MLNLYSVYSALNVRRLCALLCPAISFLHFHVLQFNVLQVGPSFSRPAFSAPPSWLPWLIRPHHSTAPSSTHWLRAPERIEYKQAVLVHQCLRGFALAYLADDLQPVTELSGRQRLRSSSTSALVVPPTRLRTTGDRAFFVAAAKTCNSMPPEVTSSSQPSSLSTFKSKLKTHLFSLSFPDL